MALTVIHTSDWHIGHQLYKKRRDEEFAAFFDWLLKIIGERQPDALIVAGDIFDSVMPGSAAQNLYYSFFEKLVGTSLRHIVITGGNHDSPSLLSIASELLRHFNIHVIGCFDGSISDEIKILHDKNGEPELIVCAIPFLRERDLRVFSQGETRADAENAIVEGLERHYLEVAREADKIRGNRDIPVIATGHLFVSGAALSADDNERQLHVGNLGGAPCSIFPPVFDYVALGHLHRAQKVGDNPLIRYSGSPLSMSFSESGKEKSITIIRFMGRSAEIEIVPAPVFQKLHTIKGSKSEILNELANLAKNVQNDEKIWVEIQHTAQEPAGSLVDDAFEMARDSSIEILCIKTLNRNGAVLTLDSENRLSEISPEDIFIKYLQAQKPEMPPAEREEIVLAFRKLLDEYYSRQENHQ